jgi:hypothetical protein
VTNSKQRQHCQLAYKTTKHRKLKIRESSLQKNQYTSIDQKLAAKSEHYKVKSYFYNYSGKYGSPQMGLSDHSVTVKVVNSNAVLVEVGQKLESRLYEFHLDRQLGVLNKLAFYNAIKVPTDL